MITTLIPAYNEERSIGDIVKLARQYTDEVVVVDDGSTDHTADLARQAGALVVGTTYALGYVQALKFGFKAAKGDIVVTMDADGEHNPQEIPLIVRPILEGGADLVMGRRQQVSRLSEVPFNWLTRRKTGISDSCTGFRAIRRDLALRLTLEARCTCGTFVLEAHSLGAIVIEVPVKTIKINKPRKTAWYHAKQLFYIIKWLNK